MPVRLASESAGGRCQTTTVKEKVRTRTAIKHSGLPGKRAELALGTCQPGNRSRTLAGIGNPLAVGANGVERPHTSRIPRTPRVWIGTPNHIISLFTVYQLGDRQVEDAGEGQRCWPGFTGSILQAYFTTWNTTPWTCPLPTPQLTRTDI